MTAGVYRARAEEIPMYQVCGVCIGLRFFSNFIQFFFNLGPLKCKIKWYVWVGIIRGWALILHRVDNGPVEGRRANTVVCAGSKHVFLKKGIFKKTNAYFVFFYRNPHIRPGPHIGRDTLTL